MKSVGPKLVPFFKTLAIYFVVFPDFTVPSLLGIALKCLPVISLMFFVLMHGMGLDDEYVLVVLLKLKERSALKSNQQDNSNS